MVAGRSHLSKIVYFAFSVSKHLDFIFLKIGRPQFCDEKCFANVSHEEPVCTVTPKTNTVGATKANGTKDRKSRSHVCERYEILWEILFPLIILS